MNRVLKYMEFLNENYSDIIWGNRSPKINPQTLEEFADFIEKVEPHTTSEDYVKFHETVEKYTGISARNNTIRELILELPINQARKLYLELRQLNYK